MVNLFTGLGYLYLVGEDSYGEVIHLARFFYIVGEDIQNDLLSSVICIWLVEKVMVELFTY